MYPTIPTAELPMINGALRFVRSTNTAIDMVAIKAMTQGGIASSCVWVALKPKPSMTVGRKRLVV